MIHICPERQQLLDCRGHSLVIGGPGSGKTTIALKKAVKRIQEGMAPGQSVMFLSFSRAAIARIAEASRVEAAKAERAFLDIQTFHSFFWELLRSHLYLLGGPKRLRLLFPHDERALSGGISDDDPLLWKAWLTERERLCRQDGRIAFDLFAPMASSLLEKSTHLRRLTAQRHPLLIIDEAQDTGPDAWNCVKQLAPLTQVICLADLEQQIFDYLPGIDPARIDDIKKVLTPLCIDLGSDNYRSPGSEIALFGRDILTGVVRGKPYAGISSFPYSPKGDKGEAVRRALGALQRKIRKATGNWGKSVAVLLPSGASAARLSTAMNAGSKPVRHKLLFDEAEAMLAARFAAFLLEPRTNGAPLADLVTALELLSDIKRASGVNDAKRFREWAAKVAKGKMPKAGLVTTLASLLQELETSAYTGDPAKDWIRVKQALSRTDAPDLWKVVRQLDYLIAFNRGKRISGNLSELWQRHGRYDGAREALDRALIQDQLVGGIDDPMGVQVMTIHKAKGKQFDGIIVVREGRHNGKEQSSTFVWMGDTSPYHRSRKILRVAVTRAITHTMILNPFWPPCPILGGHKL